MNHNKLRSLFPNAAESFIKRNSSDDSQSGTNPILQKWKDADKGKDDHRSKEEEMDGGSHPTYYVSIEWHNSDRRRRDAWGMSETIADVLVSAFRRFYGLHDTRTAKKKNGGKRSGRVRDQDWTL